MAKEKKEKKDKEEKKKDKKEKKEKKGKKEKKEKEEKPKKEKKGKKDKKEKKEKPEKPKKGKKKGKKGQTEEPETEEIQEVPEGKGKKGKKKSGKKASKKGSKKEPDKEPKKGTKKSPAAGPSPTPSPVGEGELPEGVEGAEAVVEEPKYPWFNISWAWLHILGMALMLCDSLWINVFPASKWAACLGRIAYPIFAFLLVEGFFHTKNLLWYLLRLLSLAALSEIPFNLLYGGSIVYPFHQNVIWTYIIGLLFIILLDEFKERFGQLPMMVFAIVPALFGYFLGQVLLTDYYGAGVLIILVFYLFHGKGWGCFLGQLVCLWFINLKLLGGYYYIIPSLGYNFELVQQGLATMALIPIWLYYGRQGLHGRVFRWFCYVFYPVHMLILIIVRARLG